MKVAILVLVLVALTASVAYAAPVEETPKDMLQRIRLLLLGSQPTDTADETLLEKLLQQETASEQDKQSILAQVQEEQIDAGLQEFFANEQVPVELQGWFKRIYNRAKKYVRKNKYGIRKGVDYIFGR